ncbi:unnamed protein product [Diplocarpon coronariae]
MPIPTRTQRIAAISKHLADILLIVAKPDTTDTKLQEIENHLEHLSRELTPEPPGSKTPMTSRKSRRPNIPMKSMKSTKSTKSRNKIPQRLSFKIKPDDRRADVFAAPSDDVKTAARSRETAIAHERNYMDLLRETEANERQRSGVKEEGELTMEID